jgi:hypothetical protein
MPHALQCDVIAEPSRIMGEAEQCYKQTTYTTLTASFHTSQMAWALLAMILSILQDCASRIPVKAEVMESKGEMRDEPVSAQALAPMPMLANEQPPGLCSGRCDLVNPLVTRPVTKLLRSIATLFGFPSNWAPL